MSYLVVGSNRRKRQRRLAYLASLPASEISRRFRAVRRALVYVVAMLASIFPLSLIGDGSLVGLPVLALMLTPIVYVIALHY